MLTPTYPEESALQGTFQAGLRRAPGQKRTHVCLLVSFDDVFAICEHVRKQRTCREVAGRCVHIIKKATLDGYAKKYADARGSLSTWWRITEKAEWRHIQDVRQTFSHADFDPDSGLTIFNIKGNRYRLRVRIDYERRMVFIGDFMTHAQYTKRA